MPAERPVPRRARRGSWPACARCPRECRAGRARSRRPRPSGSSRSSPPHRGHFPVAEQREHRGIRRLGRRGDRRVSTGSRWMKSKMPWPPGFRPVMKFDQATGLCGGVEVPREWMPCSRRRAREVRMRSGIALRSSRPGSPDRARRCRARPRARVLRSGGPGASSGGAAMASRPARNTAPSAANRRSAVRHRARASTDRGSLGHRRARVRPPPTRRPRRAEQRLGPACTPARHAEDVEHRRRHVHQTRLGRVDLAVRPEHARHEPRVDAVVARPALGVVGEHVVCCTAPVAQSHEWRKPLW
jgi:hypothetical protein